MSLSTSGRISSSISFSPEGCLVCISSLLGLLFSPQIENFNHFILASSSSSRYLIRLCLCLSASPSHVACGIQRPSLLSSWKGTEDDWCVKVIHAAAPPPGDVSLPVYARAKTKKNKNTDPVMLLMPFVSKIFGWCIFASFAFHLGLETESGGQK